MPFDVNPAAVYVGIYPLLKDKAKRCGYALAVHGSIARDFDLVAVPWVEEAIGPDELAEALRESVGGHWRDRLDHWRKGVELARQIMRPKPHGRRAYSIHLGGGAFIDLSVFPKNVFEGKDADVPTKVVENSGPPPDPGAGKPAEQTEAGPAG